MKKARTGGEVWRMVGVYVNGDMERKLHGLKKWMKGERQERIIIKGDFNEERVNREEE